MSWVKLECPRCRAVSSIPASQKGQYVACPGCRMKVMVSYQAPAAEAPAHAGAPSGAAANSAMPPSTSQQVPATAGATKGSPKPGATTQSANQSARAQPQLQQPHVQQPYIQPPQNQQPQFNPAPPTSQGAPGPRSGARPAAARADDLTNPFGEAPILPPPAAGPSPIYGGAAPVYGAPAYAAPSPAYAATSPAYAAPSAANALAPRAPAAPPVAAGSESMASVPGPPAPPAPYPAPVPAAVETFGMTGQRKVARFIAADTAQSTLQLAPDGQLPTLTLVDNLKAAKETNAGSSINPLVLVIAIAFSLVVCVVLLFSDVGGENSVDSAGDRIRHDLELYYKGQKEPLAPYQAHLRQAQQAHSRGDTKTAQNHYRKVLDMLRAEGRSRFRGVTGTPDSDKKLEISLSQLLGQDYTPEPMEEN